MAFRTVLGKLFLSDRDRQTIDADLRVVERYTEEVLEPECFFQIHAYLSLSFLMVSV